MLGLASGVAAAALVELTRPRGGHGRLVDWEEIRATALARTGQDRLSGPRRATLEARYAELASEMRGPLLEAVGGEPVAMPPFEALGRGDWVDVNLDILRRVIEPLLERSRIPSSLLVDLGRKGVDGYTGMMLGFLSTRVLGQFDPQLMGHEPVTTSLYLVETNVAEWEAHADLPGDDLRRWLILHEMTHAWQFAAHPWLIDFMNEAVREVLALGDPDHASPLRRAVALSIGMPSQWRTLRRVQAAMTLIEGYSNLVMNLAGRRHIASFERLEAAYHKRSGEKSVLEVLFWKLTGLDLKLQQYQRGEAFARAVHERHGMATLNLAWSAPESMPTLDELARPEAWVERVQPRRGRGTRAAAARA